MTIVDRLRRSHIYENSVEILNTEWWCYSLYDFETGSQYIHWRVLVAIDNLMLELARTALCFLTVGVLERSRISGRGIGNDEIYRGGIRGTLGGGQLEPGRSAVGACRSVRWLVPRAGGLEGVAAAVPWNVWR